jgi:hypothetical protein
VVGGDVGWTGVDEVGVPGVDAEGDAVDGVGDGGFSARGPDPRPPQADTGVRASINAMITDVTARVLNMTTPSIRRKEIREFHHTHRRSVATVRLRTIGPASRADSP